MRTFKVIVAVLLFVAFSDREPPFTRSPRATVDTALRDAQREHGHHSRALIKYRPGAERQVLQSLAAHGDRVRRVHRPAALIVSDVYGGDLERLARHPGVEGLSIDAIVTAEQVDDDDDDDEGFVAINVLRQTLGVPAGGLDGRGVGVALIDSGLAATVDFGARVLGFYDFTDGGSPAVPSDGYGHGTHVAGLIGGSGAAAGGIHAGIAPGVNLIVLKALDANGQGYTSDVINAIDFAVANRATLGIHIINLSLGHPIYEPAESDPLVQAVERAVAAGIVVVAAAGNYGINRESGLIGYTGITSPGNAPSALTVGALMSRNTVTRLDDRVAPYSSRGPTWYDRFVKPDVVAPGDKLVGPSHAAAHLYTQHPSLREANEYLRLSGTSMAAAVTTGAVALLLQANREGLTEGDLDDLDDPDDPDDPDEADDEPAIGARPPLTPNAVKAILQYSALDISDESGTRASELTAGAGALNVRGAIGLAGAIDTSEPVGATWLSGGVLPYTTIGSETLPWVQHIVWGTHIVWGSTILTNEPAWGLHIVWGTGGPSAWSDASHIVWGSNIASDLFTVWAYHIVWGTGYASVVDEVDGGHIVWGTLDPSLAAIGYDAADAARASWPADTMITAGPAATTTATSATFTFSAGDPATRFECSMDGAAMVACVSPASYEVLSLGPHTFAVRGIDALGNSDSVPVTYSWVIEQPAATTSTTRETGSMDSGPTDPAPADTTTGSTAVVDCGVPVTLTSVADTWLDENSASNNFGTDAILKVRSQEPGDNFRALVGFTLPAAPEGCVVQSAALSLYAASATEGRTIEVLRVTADWSEQSVMWSNQPGTAGPPSVTASGHGTLTWDVGALVREMYSSGQLYGFLVRDSSEGGGGFEQSFHGKEKDEQPPTLVVTYAPR